MNIHQLRQDHEHPTHKVLVVTDTGIVRVKRVEVNSLQHAEMMCKRDGWMVKGYRLLDNIFRV